MKPATAEVRTADRTGKNQIARDEHRHALRGTARAHEVGIVARGVAGRVERRHRDVLARPVASIGQGACAAARRCCALGHKRRLHSEVLHDLAQAARVLLLDVGDENGVDLPDAFGPDRLQLGQIGTGVEKHATPAAAFGNDVGIGHADAMGHPQREQAEGQTLNRRPRVGSAGQRTQPDLVEREHLRETAQLLAAQVAAPVQRIVDPGDPDPGTRRRFTGSQTGAAEGFFEHIAQFVLQRNCFQVTHEWPTVAGLRTRRKNDFEFFAPLGPFRPPMDAIQQEVLDIFKRTKALLQGHFILRSGLHSGHFFQCAQVCQRMDAVERLAQLLLPKLSGLSYTTVLAPAMGGLVIGQEVARQSKSRFIFAEKENNALVMRRGFTLSPGERVLIVEDVVTRGGRVLECLDIVRKAGGTPVGVAMLVDRSAGQTRFDVPAVALLELSFPTYAADQLPPELAALPASKPGS